MTVTVLQKDVKAEDAKIIIQPRQVSCKKGLQSLLLLLLLVLLLLLQDFLRTHV